MNIQAMMQQAQKLQKEILKAKQEIESEIFSVKKSFIEIEANGKKEILKININKESSFEKEDVEILEDLLILSVNELFKEIDEKMEKQLGKYGPGVNGLL